LSRLDHQKMKTTVRLRPIQKQGIFSRFIGPAEGFSAANRIFNGVVLATAVLCLGTAIINYLVHLPVELSAVALVSVAFYVGIFCLSRFRKIYQPAVWMASLWLLLFVGYIWIRNGGSAGATHAFLIILPFFFLPFALAGQRIVLTVLYCLISAALLTFEHFFPELIVGYGSTGDRFYDMLFATIATQLGIAFAAGLLVNEYRHLTRQLEALRITSEERFGEVADTIPAMILELGSDLTIDFANHETLLTTGLTESELRSAKGLERIIHPEDLPVARKDLTALLSGSTVSASEWRLQIGTGEIRNVLARAVARHIEGRIHGIRLYMVDITDKKRFEQQYLLAQKMESIGMLAGGIAHGFYHTHSFIANK